MGLRGISALVALMLAHGAGDDSASDRLYGRVLTDEGVVYEGFLTWDRHEAVWSDFLDAGKRIPQEFLHEAERLDPEFAAQERRRRSLVAYGVRITWDEDDDESLPLTNAAIRFGHVASISVVDARSAMIGLRSGGEVELHTTSTDIGRSMRGVVVQLADGDSVRVRWPELERVDFLPVPYEAPKPTSTRLHGTVTTWGGLELTGYVRWDRDETLGSHILDGRVSGHDREIPFSDIAEITWVDDRSSRVTLVTGEELLMRGSNDVDRDNRGVEISDPTFGRVIVHWREFESVRFDSPPSGTDRPDYAPGAPLTGTVYAVDGREIRGEVRWDNDEAQAWELLDGWSPDADLEYDIEFGSINEIDKLEPDRVKVTLFDGRTIELTDSDDVDEGNRGIFVKPQGRPRRLVRWQDFDRVVFER